MNDDIDVDFEAAEEMGDLSTAKAKLLKLREELAKVKTERQEFLDGWQRCKADAANTKQEAARNAKRSGELLREALVYDLLPVLDSFDMATGSDAWAQVNDAFRSGMEAVRMQLLDVLDRHGVRRFAKIGDTFDPRLHEIAQETDDMPGESGTIVRILRYGYSSGDITLRPAHVILKK